jgi:hypothetical protein
VAIGRAEDRTSDRTRLGQRRGGRSGRRGASDGISSTPGDEGSSWVVIGSATARVKVAEE